MSEADQLKTKNDKWLIQNRLKEIEKQPKSDLKSTEKRLKEDQKTTQDRPPSGQTTIGLKSTPKTTKKRPSWVLCK